MGGAYYGAEIKALLFRWPAPRRIDTAHQGTTTTTTNVNDEGTHSRGQVDLLITPPVQRQAPFPRAERQLLADKSGSSRLRHPGVPLSELPVRSPGARCLAGTCPVCRD